MPRWFRRLFRRSTADDTVALRATDASPAGTTNAQSAGKAARVDPPPVCTVQGVYDDRGVELDISFDATTLRIGGPESSSPGVAQAGMHSQQQPSVTVRLSDQRTMAEQIQEEVRVQIARKVAALVPTLGENQHDQLSSYVLRVVESLAQDQITRVRQILAEELKSTPHAPPDVIRALAWDAAPDVAAPVLEYSPLLKDSELIEIIASSAVPGVREAIARRHALSGRVSQALADSSDVKAITTLLRNRHAKLPQTALDTIVERAPPMEIWHEPLIFRPELTQRTLNRIAEFVSASLIDQLEAERRIPPAVAQNLQRAIKSRLQSASVEQRREGETQADEKFRQGTLVPDDVVDALFNGDKEFAHAGLRLLAQMPPDVMDRMLATRNPRVVTALAWKAGLSMRGAIQVQLRLAHIPHPNVLHARHGVDYPLSEDELRRYLLMFLPEV